MDLILSVISGRYHTARLWFANILSIKIILISTGTARPTSVNQTFVPQQYPNTKEPPPTNLYYSLLGPIHNCLEKNLRSANCKDQLMSCCWSIARFSTIQYNVLYNLATWQKSYRFSTGVYSFNWKITFVLPPALALLNYFSCICKSLKIRQKLFCFHISVHCVQLCQKITCSPQENRACHGWRGLNGKCLVSEPDTYGTRYM